MTGKSGADAFVHDLANVLNDRVVLFLSGSRRRDPSVKAWLQSGGRGSLDNEEQETYAWFLANGWTLVTFSIVFVASRDRRVHDLPLVMRQAHGVPSAATVRALPSSFAR